MSDIGVQPVTEPALGLSQWQRVVNTFTAPSKTFEDIKHGNRSWWMPLIIYTVFAYLLFASLRQLQFSDPRPINDVGRVAAVDHL